MTEADEYYDGMNRVEEIARRAVVAGFVNKMRPHASVLDIGCGDCGLLNYLFLSICYRGIDNQKEAMRRANIGTLFILADADVYDPTTWPYDIVLFCESLYCFPDPAATVGKFWDALSGDGIMIISLARGRFMNKMTDEEMFDLLKYPILNSVIVQNGSTEHVIKVYQKGK